MIRKCIPLVAAALLTALALPANAAATKKKARTSANPAPASTEPAIQPVLDPSGATPSTRAESVVVADALSGQVLYEKNSNEARQPASTQKLLTALLIVENGDLDRPVRIQLADTQTEEVKLGVRPGEVYTRRQLLEVLLVHSVNDVARALARDNAGSIEAFAERMNEKALTLGMRHSHFVNPNGLPDPRQYSTARDMARLALAAYRSPTIRGIVSTKSLFFRFSNGRIAEFKNTNHVLRDYPYCTGMKTGYTQAAGHCLISSGAKNGREVIVVALGDKDRSWLWRDSCSLLAWGLSL
ncbi:MAG: D-alanyl-D-alanine carboxypeptidase [Chthoniobacteraceae bacterium]|nr:D-alanyl-D-alanine carboxypeptidase [Chthoniobacteraceae bacterium]